jgi:hypothetical protein
MSETGQAAEAKAQGSQVTFEIEGRGPDYTDCAMWMNTQSKTFGFTNDAAVIRPHMQAVAKRLRRLDPSLQVGKD